jgi:hypothetical protein
MFSPKQAEMATVLANSSFPAGRSVLDLCQTMYGVDLILHHRRAGAGAAGGGGAVGVQLLEVQMEPNTAVKCAQELPLYAGLARGVWQLLAGGGGGGVDGHNNEGERVFEKIDL